jgi:hypothetical protein
MLGMSAVKATMICQVCRIDSLILDAGKNSMRRRQTGRHQRFRLSAQTRRGQRPMLEPSVEAWAG